MPDFVYRGDSHTQPNGAINPEVQTGTFVMDERLLTAREVADRLGVSERWVRDHATRRNPRLRAIKLGSLLQFRWLDVQILIENTVRIGLSKAAKRMAQGALRHASISTTGNIYVQVIEPNVMRAVNSHANAALDGWTPPIESLGLTGRNIKRLAASTQGSIAI